MLKANFLASAAALVLIPLSAQAQDHGGHDAHAGHDMTAPAPTPPDASPDHAAIDHAALGHATAAQPAEGSGTARLPANEGSGAHSGLHIDAGDDWMVMAHGYVWGVHTDQSGPRGDDKSYAQSMLMLSAGRDTAWGRVQIKSMFSLEPLMSNFGYPSLFATGETAGGEPLVDRQHPHDLFMELAGRIDVNVGANGARLFVYGGPVGEPAIGPSAFMHRRSARYNPEAPITHHWFDSTHITYGVATLGYATPQVQIEGSLFTGREPDERRWNLETPRFDSWSVRGTWTPTPSLAIQASHAFVKQPELLHGDQDEHRTTASIHYANRNGLSVMAAYSAKNRDPGDTLPAWLAEVNWDIDDHHSLFGRVENVLNDELFPDHDDPLHDVAFRVTKFQAGYAYRLPITGPLNLAIGGTLSAFDKPRALDAAYGRDPIGATVFARLSIGH